MDNDNVDARTSFRPWNHPGGSTTRGYYRIIDPDGRTRYFSCIDNKRINLKDIPAEVALDRIRKVKPEVLMAKKYRAERRQIELLRDAIIHKQITLEALQRGWTVEKEHCVALLDEHERLVQDGIDAIGDDLRRFYKIPDIKSSRPGTRRESAEPTHRRSRRRARTSTNRLDPNRLR